MAKQHRAPESTPPAPRETGPRDDGPLSDAALVGNAAMIDRIEPTAETSSLLRWT